MVNTNLCVCICIHVQVFVSICIYVWSVCVCVGVLEPKFTVCQMMWQQWTRQYEAFFLSYPRHFLGDNSVCVCMCVCLQVCQCGSARSGADKSSRDISILTLFSNKDHFFQKWILNIEALTWLHHLSTCCGNQHMSSSLLKSKKQ